MTDLEHATDVVAAYQWYADQGVIEKASRSERAWRTLMELLQPHLDKGRSLAAALERVMYTRAGAEAVRNFLQARDEAPLPTEIAPKRKGKTEMSRTTPPAGAEQVTEHVEALAKAKAKSDGLSLVQARAAVWREHPELVTASRAADRERRKWIAKHGGETLSDLVDRAVYRHAVYVQNTEAGRLSQPIELVKADVWRSETGRVIRDLVRTRGSEPATFIAKADDLDDRQRFALETVRSWAG